jgi:hypothetical protein
MPVPNASPARRHATGAALALALHAAAACAAAACGTKDAPDPLAPTGPTGRVRFVNVITDTTRGRVNALLEGLPIGVNVVYTGACPACLPAPSTAPYAPVYAGGRTLVLRRTADTAVTVATLAFEAAANDDRTVYAVGGAGGAAVTAFVTSDTNPAPAAGQARVRVVHLSPTAGPVDVFVTAPGANLATATPTLANVPVRGVSGYLALPAATYQVRVVPAGTAPASRAENVAINVASLALAAGANRTIVAADRNSGGAPLQAFVLVDR